jgi:hypothetical protein
LHFTTKIAAAVLDPLEQNVVLKAGSSKLPQENGSVATGLYVVEISPDWFVYRFEYQE